MSPYASRGDVRAKMGFVNLGESEINSSDRFCCEFARCDQAASPWFRIIPTPSVLYMFFTPDERESTIPAMSARPPGRRQFALKGDRRAP
jgi:hypothetical protein